MSFLSVEQIKFITAVLAAHSDRLLAEQTILGSDADFDYISERFVQPIGMCLEISIQLDRVLNEVTTINQCGGGYKRCTPPSV